MDINNEYLLVVNTYTSDAPWSNAIIEPVQHWMNELDVPVLIEHLNMLMVEDAEDFGMVEDAIFEKYGERTPKAILLLGNSSLLLRDRMRAQWGDVPMILCAEQEYYGPDSAYIYKHPIPAELRVPLTELADEYNLTVLQTRIFLKENVDLLRRLIPRLEEVMLIGDKRYVNQQLDDDMKQLMAREYPDLKYQYFSAENKTLDALLSRLDSIDIGTTGVLFSSWFSKTEIAGQAVLNANSYRVIANTIVPIFALKGSVMQNSGMVGGCFYDEETFLTHLKEDLFAVLAGTPSREIPFFIPSQAVPTFNYPALVQKEIAVGRCPSGSVFLGRPESFFQRYKYWLGGVFIVFLLSILFLYHRIRMLARLNEAQKQQVETSRELTSLFENMPVAYVKAKFLYNESGEIADMEDRKSVV